MKPGFTLLAATCCMTACLALSAQAQWPRSPRSSRYSQERTGSAGAPAAQTTQPANGSAWEDYQDMVRNNIFLRDRSSARSWENRGSGQPLDLESSLVLTGIAREGEQYVAFIENTQTRATERVRTGEEIGLGRMGPMTLDHAEYQKDGAATIVEIGMNLRGQSGDRSAAYSTEGTASTPGAPFDARPALAAPAGSEEAIIEMLRQKRLKEMGQ